MRLYFKMRDIENLDAEAQRDFIQAYVDDYCRFESCGVVLDEFIEHYVEESPLKSKTFVVGSYRVTENADFDRIEFKMKLFNVHDHFIIFAIL